jgi:mannose-6-phosphate isomerase-like protein (cupin superfamily)
VGLVDASELGSRSPLPGWTGRFFHSEHMTFAYWDIAADATPLHEHHHPNEEVWHIVEGTLAITVDGTEHVAGPGCAAIVPPDTPHAARALSAARVIVVDYPLRMQLPGTDAHD